MGCASVAGTAFTLAGTHAIALILPMLTLPTTASEVFDAVWAPVMLGLSFKLRSLEANVLGIAIGGQESGYAVRSQYGGGPAHGFWQMEEGATDHSGVRGVMNHPASRTFAMRYCADNGLPFDAHAIWSEMAEDDEVGAAFARFLLWTSSRPLPPIGDQDGAWNYYLDVWRPGKPDKTRWAPVYAAAVAAVRGSP
jgi:hypothetical protein